MAADDLFVGGKVNLFSITDVAADSLSVGDKVNSFSVTDSLSATENESALLQTDRSSVANNAQCPMPNN